MRKAQENQDRGLGGPFPSRWQRSTFPPFRVTANVIEHPMIVVPARAVSDFGKKAAYSTAESLFSLLVRMLRNVQAFKLQVSGVGHRLLVSSHGVLPIPIKKRRLSSWVRIYVSIY